MKMFSYVIKDDLGIHARPAGVLCKEAGNFESQILIRCKGKTADARKVMSIMMLCAKNGDEITLEISGEDEESAFDTFKERVESIL